MASQPSLDRILIARCDNIGDVVMLSPAVKAVRQAYPDAQLTLLASPAGFSIAGLLPWLDEVILERVLWQDASGALPFEPERERALIRKLRDHAFDAAFIFTSFSQTPYPAAYAAYLAGIPIRVGHSKEFGGAVLSHAYASPPDRLHQTERNLLLLERFGLPVQDRRLELMIPPPVESHVEGMLQRHGLSTTEPFVAIVPGASCEARRCPARRYGEVSRLLARQSGLPIVVLGSKGEQETLASVTDGDGVSLVGETNVMEFAAVLAHAGVIVANNSSALHIADAFGRPVVATYSGTDLVEQWAPRFTRCRILQRPTECSPCYGFTCPYDLECLDIEPSAVAEAAMELLEDARQGAR